MRDILFRGKTKESAMWIYGCLTIDDYIIGGEFKRLCCIKEVPAEIGGSYHWMIVDPESVGQWTGLTDKNGVKIFEGDIMYSRGNVVEFCNGSFCINGDSSIALWRKAEVIGNVYDNPELLYVG